MEEIKRSTLGYGLVLQRFNASNGSFGLFRVSF